MESKKNYFIYFAVLSTTLATFATSSCIAWTSPVIVKFGNSDPKINPIGRIITTLELAWIVSALSIGLSFGPAVSILCLKHVSKKTALLIVALPMAFAHVICMFATEVGSFIAARLLMGLGTGGVLSIQGIYIAEISEDKNRGLLGGFSGVLANLGSLFVYVVGPYVSIRKFSILNLIPLTLYYLLFGLCVPQSPYDLYMREKKQKAEESLTKLRRHSKVKTELAFIAKTIQCSTNTGFKMSDLFQNKGLLRALLICIGLMACQQLSGILAVCAYAQTIFESVGGAISSAVSTMIIGLVSLVSSITSCQLIDKMGRKFLLTISCVTESLSLFTLGIYFHLLNNGKDVTSLSWLPLVSLMIFMIGFNFGLVSLPWVIMGEVFPSNAKAVASTLVSLFNFNLSFVVTICFPYLIEYVGMAYTFWIFSGAMIFGSIFCVVFLPETKGKSFQEIQKMLNS